MANKPKSSKNKKKRSIGKIMNIDEGNNTDKSRNLGLRNYKNSRVDKLFQGLFLRKRERVRG